MNNSINKRDTARNSMKRILINSKKADSFDIAEIEVYISLLGEQWEKFQTAQEDVELSCGAETLAEQEPEREQGETWFREALTNFTRARNKIKSEAIAASSRRDLANEGQTSTFDSHVSATRTEIRLPPMKLPCFDGNSKEWKPFEDSFTAFVHNDSSISCVQKLHFLLSSLQGPALQVVKGFRITSNNYDQVWELLKKRYDSTRIIVDSHFQALFSIRKLNIESSASIRSLLDETQEHYRSLKAIGRPVANWDDWLVHLTVSKLDAETHRQWELTQTDDKVATFNELIAFLETRCRSLDAISFHQAATVTGHKNSTTQAVKNKKTNSLHTTTEPTTSDTKCSRVRRRFKNHVCPFCSEKHFIFTCDKFRSTEVAKRISFVHDKLLCTNCLASGHKQAQCKSKFACRVCNARHHTLLHGQLPTDSTELQMPIDNTLANNSTPSYASNSKHHVLLGTAMVMVMDNSNRLQPARLLFDNGSHASFVTESCVQRLHLRRTPVSTAIEGIGATTAGFSKGEVELTITSYDRQYTTSIQAQILNKITSHLPPVQVQNHSWPHIEGLVLADPCFQIPAAVDILIGSDELSQFLCTGLIKGPYGTPVAQKSTLGWILMGKVIDSTPKPPAPSATCLMANAELTKAISRFWEIETLPEVKHLTVEERLCEQFYDETHYRQEDGRFVVQLPFKPDCPIGSSRNAAVRSLLRMEKQFAKDKELFMSYKNFIAEFIELGHMERVDNQPLIGNHFYLPHRAVFKESSTTTKLRVVFNASCRSSTGFSLNDTQMIGPQLQPDLYSILLRLRTHRFAMTADVAKMYRQVRVHQKHVDFQRIVWRNSPDEDIKDYRLLTVTYGVASASHLAIKSLQKAALVESPNSLTTQVILRDFYMDDLLTGCYKEDDLHRLQVEISDVLSRSGFHLRKWSSNSSTVINAISPDEREVLQSLSFDEIDGVRTLGLQWVPSIDHLAFSVQLNKVSNINVTKRLILSDTAKLFDPLGLLSPSTIIPKMLFQSLWRPKVDWDETVPQDVKRQWLHYRDHITCLAAIKVPRWVGTGIPGAVTDLHGFADASQSAYAAAIYVRTVAPNGRISVMLLTAKTRVAPLKTTILSLPRLELCGALLLAKLIKHAKDVLSPHVRDIYGWTDSTVALAWIRQQPGRWATFVANRVSEIQQTVPPGNWFHVQSSQNPADCATRGVLPNLLSQHPLWWTGPSWLAEEETAWPEQRLFTTSLDQRAESANLASNYDTTPIWDLVNKFSSLRKLKRITGYVIRFVDHVRYAVKRRKLLEGETLTPPQTSRHLHLSELDKALNFWIGASQKQFFADEIQRLGAKKPVSRSSKLLRLNPFLDEENLIRVGGRLSQSSLQPDRKYPIVLPSLSKLAQLICDDVHAYTLHAGPQSMLATIQSRYWIIGARKIVRKVFKSCPKCRRYSPVAQQQIMADLPWSRLQVCRPFLRSGVDFAGPLHLRFSKGRGAKSVKGYISVFICMSTGAIHLELASGLSSDTFIAAFKRFVSRRGQCKELFSDNGTNFVGAEKELRTLLTSAMKDDNLAKHLSEDGTVWHFNPPAAPHMGGYWEAAVKRVKYHLRRTLGETLLTYEELTTLLAEVEACVNSRPLCATSSCVDDLSALTPGHFIIGEPLKTIPEPNVEDFKGHLVSRWHLISKLRQHFWKRWSSEYLVQLQQRGKWHRERPNFQIGDLVLIRDEKIPPARWKLGRITQLHPGPDDRVRVVTMKTAEGELMRPIVKISPLLKINDNTVN